MAFVNLSLKNNYFIHSVTIGFYDFSGRTSAKEYGQYFFFYLIGLMIMVVADLFLQLHSTKELGFLTFMYFMMLFVPTFNVSVRRLNDYNAKNIDNVSAQDLIIKALTRNYSNFSGRARRKEFWMFHLFCLVAAVLIMSLDLSVFTSDLSSPKTPLSIVYVLVAFTPYLSVNIRRLHDVGKPAWYLLWGFVPVVGIVVLLYFFCKESDRGDNRYGPPPGAFPGYSDSF